MEIWEADLTFSSCPNLEYICVDQNNILRIQNLLKQYNYTKCNVNSYCSFVPGEAFYTVQGKNKIDVFNDGCDALDPFVSNLKYSISNGTLTDYLFSDNSGNYNITVQAGTYTITPLLENSEYFTVSPASLKLTIPLATNIDSRDFCISLKNPKPDLEITMLPLDVARPGFYTKYKIIYKNKGNIPQSGEISLSYDDAILDVISAVPQISSEKTNTLSWKFENLKPLEMKEILVDMNLNSPTETPPVNNNDILKLKAVISSEQIDITPDDNYFALNQIVVGAVDPNDKTCLEGNIIKPELIGEYVHYLIRFENIGTYYAENIVVKDMIDLSKFDISTLVPTSSSHSYIIKISEGNKVEFIFEKIKLPFDDAHNDGYIAFKIKTLPTLKVGDTFENEANIYFDYNFPILTNKASSTFKNLGTQDFEFSQYFNIYPNPVKDILNINSKVEVEKQAMSVYDMLGQLIIAIPHAENVSKIDVSKLQTGNYILKVKTNSGTSAVKFIKD
ncbi:T9SS type A sorting domain-containing protein [Flavobacterium sp. P21]|uniref:T9SS type A sorting domain-containing protein n=1 Tax=Flavobacterium sp. P21 TaxID=3423948 RepID=UPI003D675AA6